MKEIVSDIFGNLFKQPEVPSYYFDNTLSDAEKFEKDWETISNDFKNTITWERPKKN